MRLRRLSLGVLALVPVVPIVPTRAEAAPVTPAPVTSVVPLASRPDIAAMFEGTVDAMRTSAAASMSRTATARLGAITPAVAKRLGRSTYYRPGDIALYAVPLADRSEEDGRSFSVMAVPLFATVHPDGTVSPPPVPRTGLVDPTFSTQWGDEEFINWELWNSDNGGVKCSPTKGKVAGQWEWARLRNVKPSAAYDYWGVAQSAVATIKDYDSGCQNSIEWFLSQMQFRGPKVLGAAYSPRSMSEGSCSRMTLSVSATFLGIGMSISQPVERCERWFVEGANAPSALEWYGVKYQRNGVWNKHQRESASLQIVRVPRGGALGLHLKLGLDVDNR